MQTRSPGGLTVGEDSGDGPARVSSYTCRVGGDVSYPRNNRRRLLVKSRVSRRSQVGVS